MSINLWTIVFIFISLSALLGGIYHRSANALSDSARRNLWRVTVYVIAFASFALLYAAAASAFAGSVLVIFVLLALVKLLISLGVLTFSDKFKPVMYDYGLSLLVAAFIYGLYVGGVGSIWMISGIVLSLIASVVQSFDLKLSNYFNHNDIYHVIMAVALVCMYLGVR